MRLLLLSVLIFPGSQFSNESIVRLIYVCIGTAALSFYKVDSLLLLDVDSLCPVDRLMVFLRLFVIYDRNALSVLVVFGRITITLRIVIWEAPCCVIENCNNVEVNADLLNVVFFEDDLSVINLGWLDGVSFDGTLVVSPVDLINAISDVASCKFEFFDDNVLHGNDDIRSVHALSSGYRVVVEDDRVTGYASTVISDFISRMMQRYPAFATADCFRAFRLCSTIFGINNFRKLLRLFDRLYCYIPVVLADFVFGLIDYYVYFSELFHLIVLNGVVFRCASYLARAISSPSEMVLTISDSEIFDLFSKVESYYHARYAHPALILELFHAGIRGDYNVDQVLIATYDIDSVFSALFGIGINGSFSSKLGFVCRVFDVGSFGIDFCLVSFADRQKLLTFIYCVSSCGVFPLDVVHSIVNIFLFQFAIHECRLALKSEIEYPLVLIDRDSPLVNRYNFDFYLHREIVGGARPQSVGR